ncbi:hypothetical protein F5Y05DRAFT_346769 [Hypoxylon sp. FL0543]|nr:hypothetical protein F5Y05DRAFT_346769 [Hypoxylon sp. FL0543]
MIFKKSTVALGCSSNLPALFSSPHLSHCITSSCNRTSRWPQCQEPSPMLPRRRLYATISDGPKKSAASSDKPHAWPSSPHPTPYEIFGQHKSAPYSKTKFYELVKIYHPDRHRHVHAHSLSHTARLERYRLVVAANQILSDPTRRRAYDLYGAGWGGVRSMENMNREVYRSWRNTPGNPSMNATWEDWERWYNERDGKKEQQRPVYVSNQLFASVLCIFVVIGSIGQARRAGTNTVNLVEMKDQHHAAISESMRKLRSEKAVLSRQERIESFLRDREGWAIASSANPHASTASGRNGTTS